MFEKKAVPPVQPSFHRHSLVLHRMSFLLECRRITSLRAQFMKLTGSSRLRFFSSFLSSPLFFASVAMSTITRGFWGNNDTRDSHGAGPGKSAAALSMFSLVQTLNDRWPYSHPSLLTRECSHIQSVNADLILLAHAPTLLCCSLPPIATVHGTAASLVPEVCDPLACTCQRIPRRQSKAAATRLAESHQQPARRSVAVGR